MSLIGTVSGTCSSLCVTKATLRGDQGKWSETSRLAERTEEVAAYLAAAGRQPSRRRSLLASLENLREKFRCPARLFPLLWSSSGAFQAVLDFYHELDMADRALIEGMSDSTDSSASVHADDFSIHADDFSFGSPTTASEDSDQLSPSG